MRNNGGHASSERQHAGRRSGVDERAMDPSNRFSKSLHSFERLACSHQPKLCIYPVLVDDVRDNDQLAILAPVVHEGHSANLDVACVRHDCNCTPLHTSCPKGCSGPCGTAKSPPGLGLGRLVFRGQIWKDTPSIFGIEDPPAQTSLQVLAFDIPGEGPVCTRRFPQWMVSKLTGSEGNSVPPRE